MPLPLPSPRGLATGAGLVGLALVGASMLPWVELAVRARDALEGTPAVTLVRTGVEGPVATGGRLVAAFGALGALLVLPIACGRPLLIGPRRAGLHAVIAFGLATWFAVHGLRRGRYDVLVAQGGETVVAHAAKIATGVGLGAALVLAPLGGLLAVAAWWGVLRGTPPRGSAPAP